MTVSNRRLRFGEFELDVEQKLLTVAGREVQLTPKAMALLLILVQNRGRIVEKSELIESVWSDSIVEEGNLPYTVKLLRKSLGDEDRSNPVFIETVPRRGYRFIAPVSEVKERAIEKTPASPSVKNGGYSNTLRYLFSTGLIVVVVSVAGLGSWLATGRAAGSSSWASPLDIKRISTDGKTAIAVVSPDGESVVYVRGVVTEKESIRLRHLRSGSDVELVPNSDAFYFGLAFSPDSKFIYFARRPHESLDQASIYRKPLLGGVPELVIPDAQGWFSLSPDGTRIAFVQRRSGVEADSSLWLADALDGRNQRELAARISPLWIGANAFSLNGKELIFAAGRSMNGASEMQLFAVDLLSGKERPITRSKFHSIKALARLSRSGGFLMTASSEQSEPARLWQVEPVSGDVMPVTSDAGNYSWLSVDDKERFAVTTNVFADYRVFISPLNGAHLQELPAAANIAKYSADNKIIFSSAMTGNLEIWAMDGNGGSQSQLTTNPRTDTDPVPSNDGRHIYFSSNRSGDHHVWSMNVDGTDQKQLTSSQGGFPILVTNDGEWVFYRNGIDGTLWRVRSSGGGESVVLDETKEQIAVSPDGELAVAAGGNTDSPTIEVISLSDGNTVKTLQLPGQMKLVAALAWYPDSKSIGYAAAERSFGAKKLFLQRIDGSAPVTIADIGNENIWSLSFSADGSRFLATRGGWKHDAVLLSRSR